MKYLDLSIEELHNLLKEGKVTPKELAEESLKRAKDLQPVLNAFVTINPSVLEDASKVNFDDNSPLSGIPYAVKDNFSTKGLLSTGSSKILSNYIPVYESTVTNKLAKAGSINIGKTVMDELALGGTGLNGYSGIVYNPYDLNRISGGSSAGSAVAVAAGIVPFAIGSDTGDSVRKPAAYNGVVGFKPTWGRISRFGLFPFAPSLDHVAYFTRTVKDSAYVLETIAGKDYNDSTCSLRPVEQYSKNLNDSIKGKKVAVINEINNSASNPLVQDNFKTVIKTINDNGGEVIEFNVDEKLLKAILPAYLVISCAEATSNDANLDGIRFGFNKEGETYIDSMFNTRTEGFSPLVKRRFVIGSYALAKENQEKLFIRAQKVRRAIVNEINKILESCDVILFPCSGDVAPLREGKAQEQLSSDYLIGENHLAIGNFGGFPSITIPSGFVDNMPVGVNITGKLFDEQGVLDVAAAIEKLLGFKNQVCKVGE